ncbi:MAG: ATP-NAD kinase family protein [Theionarchaea archaeon]|nr:ATP-NAD kinase family protein [Theionarchaea archaeon]
MIGLIVNPVAGLGGPVGLKGTDGLVEEALLRGGQPRSEMRAVRMLKHIKADVCTCRGIMGAHAAEKAGTNYTVVYDPQTPTTSRDTVEAARIMEKKVDLLVFCGGDGTARDISSAVNIPILGVPSGVKMYSSCFAVTPESAAETVNSFVSGKLGVHFSEILDIDENMYRKGILSISLYGYAPVPQHTTLQRSKQVISDGSYQKREIAAFIAELIRDDTIYIMGAGTTTKAIGDFLRVDKTLLGVDVFRGRQLVKKDCSEKDILEILETERNAKIIVSPIGGQGFLFGRGNQQLSPSVIRKVGVNNVIVVAAPEKLMSTPVLYVDTGDTTVDRMLEYEHLVICGYNLAVRKRVVS